MEKIDSVEMVREIRDTQYEQTKGMSRSEYLRYVKEAGGRAMEAIKQMAHAQSIAA